MKRRYILSASGGASDAAESRREQREKLIRRLVLFAGVWSVFPWGLIASLCLRRAPLPGPDASISFTAPWWGVILVWSVEPLLWFLLWRAPASKGITKLLAVFVCGFVGFGLWRGAPELMVLWLGPTMLLLPALFRRHRGARTIVDRD